MSGISTGDVLVAVAFWAKDACRLQHKFGRGIADKGLWHVGMGLTEMGAYTGTLHVSLMRAQAFEVIRAG